MTLVTISRGSYTRGREIAEKVAQRMNYELISREILIEASEQFNIPEIRLERALHDAPSVLDRFTYGRERYLAYIRAAMLQHMAKDNVVYHGLAGHAFLYGVGHLLRVRIRADMEDRVKEEMSREGISEDKARYILSKDDEERRKWSIFVTGYDPCDPATYDVVFNASVIDVDDIVDMICQLLSKPYLQKTDESQKQIEELATAAQIKVHLVREYPSAEVAVKDWTAYVNVTSTLLEEDKLIEDVRGKIPSLEGVRDVVVHVIPSYA
jgi:cytidylate kinase